MPHRIKPEETLFIATVRFVQGYRFLDRCGEALIQLENKLDEGWMSGDPDPQRGGMRNYRLGLALQLTPRDMQTRQDEFISFEHFKDQTCRIFEIVRNTFEIEHINAPTLKVIVQVPFNSPSECESEEYIRSLGLFSPAPSFLEWMTGDEEARSFVFCTTAASTFAETATTHRQRVAISGIQQERRPAFDGRLTQRLALLPPNERRAIPELRKLLRSHPPLPPAAARFDFETSLESEFLADRFPMEAFLDDAREWTLGFQGKIEQLSNER